MLDAVLKDTSGTPDESMNMFIFNFAEVERDVSIFCAPENDVLGVEHFFVEPEDALDSYLTRKGEETKLEFLDGMLEEIDEGVFDGKMGFPRACEDHPSGGTMNSNDVVKSDYGPYKESCLRNMGLENDMPGFDDRGCGVERLDLASSNISMLESKHTQGYPLLDNMTVLELHEAFKSMYGSVTLVEDKQWLKRRILLGLYNKDELEKNLKVLEHSGASYEKEQHIMVLSSNDSSGNASCGFTSLLENEDMSRDLNLKDSFGDNNTVETLPKEVTATAFNSLEKGGVTDTVVTKKRLRKPTKRYIEEHSGNKSRCYNRKFEVSYKSSKDRMLLDRSQKKHRHKGSGSALLVSQEESLNVACIQVPFGLPIQEQEQCTEKKKSCLGQDSKDHKRSRSLGRLENFDVTPFAAESPQDSSDDDCVSNNEKSRSRRKHHRSWTISEVMKLIEGVSRYGVGRWVEIKRLLFSSSQHRTSVDLKDKWRNLLKASCSQVEQSRKQASHQVPESVLRRVRDLAAIHPYPKESKSKMCTNTSSSTSQFSHTKNNSLVPLVK